MKFVPFDLDVAKREVEGHSIVSIQIHKVPYAYAIRQNSQVAGPILGIELYLIIEAKFATAEMREIMIDAYV
ncbi:hypothetical protein MTR_1g095440 [Medicago truncatula]|uniref:Uncharacterized protein n=1 Tax=Medicago truncatula TaxID=3880 RepID=G7I3C4_MEDTR|nr:hypothetical protein MTR_1g095440 [Medicago truncatula]